MSNQIQIKRPVHPDFVRLMPNYTIRVGSARGTTMFFTANNFMKLFVITENA